MRPLLPLVLLVLASCGDPNAGRLFAEVDWAVRCDMMGGCTGSVSHTINNFTGEEGHTVSCSVAETASNRNVSFTVSGPDGESMAIRNAQFALAGGAAGGSCNVQVEEGANTYAGACGGSDPSTAQPCRVNAVMFRNDDSGGAPLPTIEGDIFCQELHGQTNPALVREVTDAGDGTVPAMSPAHFRVVNCRGLTL